MSCALSIVVAHVDPRASLERALVALDQSCVDLGAEVVVVHTGACGAVPLASRQLPTRAILVTSDALVPQLWAIGSRVARGRAVAFTLANCAVSPEWARQVVAALDGGATGVAGPLAPAVGLGIVDRAVYYLRYSAFMPSRVGDGETPGEIPGDNAAYRRETLEKHRAVLADGFWEVLFHRPLRAAGGVLYMRRQAVSYFTGGVDFRRALAHRFAHGRHFGAWRVDQRLRQPWQIVAAAPLVPWLLMLRAAGRVLPHAEHRWAFVRSAPIVFVVASAWAAGEAVGALSGARLPPVVVSETIEFGTA